jgi:hypothetical protein
MAACLSEFRNTLQRHPAFTPEAGVVLPEAMFGAAQGSPLRQATPKGRQSMINGLS